MEKRFVLWGHNLKDYCEMFDLNEENLSQKIIEYSSGASSFNFEMKQRGQRVVSCSTLYDLNEGEIARHLEAVFDTTEAKIKANLDRYPTKSAEELDGLLRLREAGIQKFLKDYALGRDEQRYQAVPANDLLPYPDFEFNLGLITHHLFVNYADKGVDEHVHLINEMLRVAGEVRVFPLLNKNGGVSELLGPVMLALQQQNLAVEVRQVKSQLQKSGNAMLRVMALQCHV